MNLLFVVIIETRSDINSHIIDPEELTETFESDKTANKAILNTDLNLPVITMIQIKLLNLYPDPIASFFLITFYNWKS